MNTVSKIEKAGNNAANKIRAGYEDTKASVASEYTELSDIQKDLKALKTHVAELSGHVQSNGTKYVREAKDYAMHQVERAQEAAKAGLDTVERRVQEKPGQTLAAAFFAGIVASLLFGRR